MSPERTKIEINIQAEALLNMIVEKTPVLREGEKISVLSGKPVSIEGTGGGSYNSTHYSLFLTSEGLIEQKRVLEYISSADGFPYSEDEKEYPVKPSYLLVQQYRANEDDLEALGGLLHQLQSRIA